MKRFTDSCIVRFAFLLVASSTISLYAQANGSVSSTVITDGIATSFSTIWGVAKWIMQAILVIVSAVIAFKTATEGSGHDKTGGWIAVISCLLIAIGLTFVPTIADTLFGIKF